ncbi:hypothetical protein GCK72_023378 [Caenorhabditis remanei]|nr:hypothetical protein GCK72_023378 [Caenorhabditis remanei]KAF1746920.1 hypothetical protein GCK72_023378 [Caenorhabditis remanei]
MSRVCYSQFVLTDCGPAVRYLTEEIVGNVPQYRVGILFLNPHPAVIRPFPLHANPFNAYPLDFQYLRQVNPQIFEGANVNILPEERPEAQQTSVIVKNPNHRKNQNN